MSEWRIWGQSTPVPDDRSWDEAVDRLTDVLVRESLALGPVVGGRVGTLDAVFLVETPDLRAAAELGLRIYSDAIARADDDVAPIRIEVEPDDFEPTRAVGATDVAKILGVSRQRVYELLDVHQDFPRPVAELSRGRVWDWSEVVAWKERWERRSGRPRSAAKT